MIRKEQKSVTYFRGVTSGWHGRTMSMMGPETNGKEKKNKKKEGKTVRQAVRHTDIRQI